MKIFLFFRLGYEIIGLDKVPDNGAALLVYYHGALPIDMYYIIAKIFIYKKRSLKNVVATFLFRLPGRTLERWFTIVYTRKNAQVVPNNKMKLEIKSSIGRESLFRRDRVFYFNFGPSYTILTGFVSSLLFQVEFST